MDLKQPLGQTELARELEVQQRRDDVSDHHYLLQRGQRTFNPNLEDLDPVFGRA